MQKQQTSAGIAYTNMLMQRLMERYLIQDVLPGETRLAFSEQVFERLLRHIHAEGYGK